MNLIRYVKDFASEEDGVTAIEYAFIASLIALAAVTVMGTVGNSLNSLYTLINGYIKTS